MAESSEAKNDLAEIYAPYKCPEKPKREKKRRTDCLAPVRILSEFLAVKDMANERENFRNFRTECDSMLKWNALIVPQKEPYNTKAWRIEVELDRLYPRKAPKVLIKTKIYHPNISEKGELKLPILEKWSPSKRMEEVIDAIIDLFENPLVEDEALIANSEAGDLFKNNRDDFNQNATDHANKFGVRRPPPLK